MELVKKGWGDQSYTTDIQSAVETECDGSDYGIGSARKAARFAGELVALLHSKGVLLDDDVLRLLGSDYKWQPEPV